MLTVGTDHFTNHEVVFSEIPRQTRPIGAGAFDPNRNDLTKRTDPASYLLISDRGCLEPRRRLDRPDRIGHRDGVLIQMSVDTRIEPCKS